MEERKKSTHKAEVFAIERVEPHPNADLLEVVPFAGYQTCVRKGEYKAGDLAIFVCPDSVVQVSRPEFSFLIEQAKSDGTARVKAKRLRGIVSYGLLIPAPPGAQAGDDLADKLGILRYEPPEPGESRLTLAVGGEEEAGPGLDMGPIKYDIDAFERYAALTLMDGEPLLCLEKLDGENMRAVYHNGRFYVKTRKRWVRRVDNYSHITPDYLMSMGCTETKANDILNNIKNRQNEVHKFWQFLEKTPALMAYLKDNPGTTVFGELFGTTQRLKYGLPDGNRISAFDVYRDGQFLDADQMLKELSDAGVPVVPNLGVGIPYNFETVKAMSEGTTTVPGAKPIIREGVVVRPMKERWNRAIGRVILKAVNPDFLAKS